ncbi:hypothetical protein M9458_039617, partial [Cirrhinus mrigala]
ARRRVSLLAFQHVKNLHALFLTCRGSGHTRVLHSMPGARWIGLPTLRGVLGAGTKVQKKRHPWRLLPAASHCRQRAAGGTAAAHGRPRTKKGCSTPPGSPVCFAEESLRPTPGASEIISFGAEEGDDLDEALSLTASEKDRASEEHSEVEGHAAFQDKLVRILTRAVSDLGLEWEKAGEPARSKLDS